MSDIQYPPTAATRDRVTEQPKPASPMTLSKAENDKQSPQRLRGGCIPCPNGGCCFCIPLPCC
ncbi:hypothetical protein BKA70DRAFT_1271538 [Coprinopsis sp. MPI-PUGE-AT-0042]|nr:hypothetical protein BKA70DRAFT_1271538 [Coprinopsis sp. MPI-PUGE-AT-0042]